VQLISSGNDFRDFLHDGLRDFQHDVQFAGIYTQKLNRLYLQQMHSFARKHLFLFLFPNNIRINLTYLEYGTLALKRLETAIPYVFTSKYVKSGLLTLFLLIESVLFFVKNVDF